MNVDADRNGFTIDFILGLYCIFITVRNEQCGLWIAALTKSGRT